MGGLIAIGLIWFVIKVIQGISDGISNTGISKKKKADFKALRDSRYSARTIDKAESLYNRNRDIIWHFNQKVIAHPSQSGTSSYRYSSRKDYFFENLTRDCINEIALAENELGMYAGTAYLNEWKTKASENWLELANAIEACFLETQKSLLEKEKQLLNETRRKQKEMSDEDDRIANARNVLGFRIKNRVTPKSFREIKKTKKEDDINISYIDAILQPSLLFWYEKENSLINPTTEELKRYPLFVSEIKPSSANMLNQEINAFNFLLDEDEKTVKSNKDFFSKVKSGYSKGIKDDVITRLDYVINHITLPTSIPKNWNVDFDEKEGIAIVEVMLPDVVHGNVFKEVELKSGKVRKPLNQKERLEQIPNIHPAIILRYAYEIFKEDTENVIKLLVLNGWVEFDDQTTGNRAKVYTASLVVTKEQIINLNLTKLNPLAAFMQLKGKSAGKLIDIIPITPTLSLDRKDKRFIETREVLNTLNKETNLASMDWQDFENLIAELFQKVFGEDGSEVKLTQSSRDKGVDAIVINPDPIKGGKFVIQAKRYSHTVDVSAVRDLVAVVAHEGASRGILVTTSTFGADAYAFVQNKPITLLDGAELLGLLEKYDYKFRINLAEARKLL